MDRPPGGARQPVMVAASLALVHDQGVGPPIGRTYCAHHTWPALATRSRRASSATLKANVHIVIGVVHYVTLSTNIVLPSVPC